MKNDPKALKLLLESYGWKQSTEFNLPRVFARNDVFILNGFTATFYNYYVIVYGEIPLHIAKDMYDKHKDLGIRVNGDGNNQEPTFKNSENKQVNNLASELFKKSKSISEAFDMIDKKCNELRDKLIDTDPESFYIDCYHIDTLEGVKVISDSIKAHNLRVDWF